MNYQEFDKLKIDYVLNKLDFEKKEAIEKYLENNPDQQEQITLLNSLYGTVDSTEGPEHSAAMDEKFYEFLTDSITQDASVSNIDKIQGRIYFSINKLFLQRLAFGIGLLAIGYFAGSNFNYQSTDIKNSTEYADAETEAVRNQLVLALIDQSSASKRLQGVNEAAKLDKVTETIVAALFSTLNNDDNSNVRLAAVESLAKYVDNPIVREGLIYAVDKQDSPLVQIALADLMVEIQAKKSLEPMRKMLKKPDINEAVRQKITESIDQII